MVDQNTTENKENQGAKNVMPDPKKNTVEVDKATLDSILARVETLETKNKEKDDEIEMLKSISDKARLANYQEKTKGPIIRKARVCFWDGSPIIGWSKLKDEVGYRDGRLQVNQQIKIFIQEKVGGKPVEKDLDYLYWVQNVISEEGEIKKKTEVDGRIIYTVVMKDGREISLDLLFVNAF
jgi:hypothetical protein